MKMTYLGIQRIEGYKKLDGAPFDMCICYVAVPIESGNFGKAPKITRINGHGWKPAEISATSEAVAKFEKVPFGAVVDLEIDQQFFGGELKSVVIGVKAVQPALKQA